jgi:hypothetical protein
VHEAGEAGYDESVTHREERTVPSTSVKVENEKRHHLLEHKGRAGGRASHG